MIARKISVKSILEADNSSLLFEEYANESKSDLLPQSKISHDAYIILEDSGVLDSYGLYTEDNVLVGFLASITQIIPKYKELMCAIDSFFILKEYRKGGGAKILLGMAKREAKKRGAVNVLMFAPVGSSLSKVAPSFGFTATNIIYIGGVDE